MSEAPPLLEMRGITKSFGAVQALRNVNFAVGAGEIVVLLGENGAGKSTLLKTVTGVHAPNAGQVLWQGKPVTIDSPPRAQALGIRMVYQELNLAPHLSVAANICLGVEPTKHRGLIVDHAAVRARARHVLQSHRFELDPDALVGNLGPAQRQLVELCKALASDARLLLLDEPTSSLGEREIEDLFATLRGLKAKGLGIVYVSHRLPECFVVGDRIVVLRDGAAVYQANVADTNTATVVGIAGLLGSGRSTLLSTLFGLRAGATGNVRVDNAALDLRRGAREAIRRGVGLLTEDRAVSGLALSRSVRENTTLAALAKAASGPCLSHRRDRTAARRIVEQLGIKTASTETPVSALSGGNQQKVVLGRWLLAGASVLLLDEPTRGVDVGSKVEIYKIINDATKAGATVLMVLSDLPELLGMSDRILVLHQGHLVADLPRVAATAERVLHFSLTGRDIEKPTE